MPVIGACSFLDTRCCESGIISLFRFVRAVRPVGGLALGHSRVIRLDRRTRAGRAYQAARAAYLDQVPQPPGPCDVALAERLAITQVELGALDERALSPAGLSATETRLFVALNGLHSRLLRQLSGRRAARPVGPSLSEYLATRQRGAAA
jgi:hypothetical protein